MPGAKGQKAVHACMIRLLNLGPAKHEKVAIYVVNQRISNVCRIAGAASQRSNSQASVGGKIPFGPQHLQYNIAEKNSNHFIFILFFLLCIGILTFFSDNSAYFSAFLRFMSFSFIKSHSILPESLLLSFRASYIIDLSILF